MDNHTDPLSLDPKVLNQAAKEYREKGQRLRQESLVFIRLSEIAAELAEVLSGNLSPEQLQQSLAWADARRRRLANAGQLEMGSEAKPKTQKYGPAVLDHPESKTALPLAKLTYADAAYQILKFVGHPMTGVELRDAMEKGGKPIQGKQPSSTLATSLRRDARFHKVDGEAYALKEEAIGAK